jgi:DNA-binding CsgD family transcriptional regulator
MSSELEPVVNAEIVDDTTPLSETEAKTLNTEIQSACASFTTSREHLQDLLEQAFCGKIDAALGYPSWSAWVAENVDITPSDKTERQLWAAAMSGKGMSQRAIADVLGVSVGTVNADIAGVQNRTPDGSADVIDITTGRDGKTYQRGPKAPPQSQHDIDRQAEEMAVIDQPVAEQEALNRWSQAVDFLTGALAYAKDFSPPNTIPHNYISIDEFLKRRDTLHRIAHQWETEIE